MGSTPIPRIMVNALPYQMLPEAEIRTDMRGRFSRRRELREAAHKACLEMIRRHEVALGERDEFDWVPKPSNFPRVIVRNG